MKSKELTSSGLLVLTALIWGTAFVAQRNGLDFLKPCAFNGIRSLIGGLALLPCIMFLDILNGRKISIWGTTSLYKKKKLLCGGLCCGTVLALASVMQQYGIAHTSVGKAGFITTLYIIIVPLLGLFMHKKVGLSLWISVILAVIGMYLLCFKGGQSINKGDIQVFICSILFSFHILVIDHFAPEVDCVRMSCIQFFLCGILSLCGAGLLEPLPDSQSVMAAWKPLLYAGVMSSGVAYTLQVVAQKNVHPVIASLLMSLESVFAALSGWLLLHEKLSPKEVFGCAIIFAAVILAQIPFPSKTKQIP